LHSATERSIRFRATGCRESHFAEPRSPQIPLSFERASLHEHDDSPHVQVEVLLIAKFRGRYRYGSAGAPDAAFIAGLTQTALEVWNAAAVVLDLSEVSYEWGDEMDLLFDVGASRGAKSAIVVGPACARAIATLMWGTETTRLATEAEKIFDTVEEAWRYVRKTAD
jgi:hypothetical protein